MGKGRYVIKKALEEDSEWVPHVEWEAANVQHILHSANLSSEGKIHPDKW